MTVINFDNVIASCSEKTEKQIICTNKPLFHEIEKVYGKGCVTDVLVAYLFKFQSLLNIKDENKLNNDQISMCADNILPFLRGLTIGEIAMMFKRFSSGEFGKFYGNIDIMTIGEWVRAFKKKRSEVILKNNDVRKYILMRDQNYDEDKVSWRK